MLKYWLNRLLAIPTVSHLFHRSLLVYRERNRTIEIRGENRVGGFEIDLSPIMSWSNAIAEFISEDEKLQVAAAAAQAAAAQWGERVTVKGVKS